jgi:hypothetical protein
MKKQNKKGKKAGKSKTSELSKKMLLKALPPAIEAAANKAMKEFGYAIVAFKGWVVRMDEDGSVTRIKKIKHASPSQLVLD